MNDQFLIDERNLLLILIKSIFMAIKTRRVRAVFGFKITYELNFNLFLFKLERNGETNSSPLSLKEIKPKSNNE